VLEIVFGLKRQARAWAPNLGQSHEVIPCGPSGRSPSYLVLSTLPAFGQSNVGELRLKVTDPMGPGVRSSVELVSKINEFRDTYPTDAHGNLTAKLLPFGVYQLRVLGAGFSPYASRLEIRSVIPRKYRITLSLAASNIRRRPLRTFCCRVPPPW